MLLLFNQNETQNKTKRTMKTLNYHLLASNDDLRPSMQYIALQTKDYTVCTDANILMYAPFHDVFGVEPTEALETLLEQTIYIHKDEYKKIANKDIADVQVDENRNELRFIENKKWTTYTVRYETELDSKYPNWEAVLPDQNSKDAVEHNCFDLAFLVKIYNVIKPRTKMTHIDATYHGVNKAITFQPKDKDMLPYTKGIYMPCYYS